MDAENEDSSSSTPTNLKMKISILIEVTTSSKSSDIQRVISEELTKLGLKINSFRYTYIETNLGTIEMPKTLFLLMLLLDNGINGFRWKLPEFSGRYEFVIPKNETQDN